jgi:hypothetical protein
MMANAVSTSAHHNIARHRHHLRRHARPYAGHPCLLLSSRKTWMAGTSPAMTRLISAVLC